MLAGKWVELLKEIAPSLVRIAVIKMPQHATNAKLFQWAQIVATSLNVELIDASIRSPADIENAVAMIADKPDSGLLVLPSPPLVWILQLRKIPPKALCRAALVPLG